MKKRSYTIISAVISLVFAAAIANLIAGFYIDKQSGPEKTLKKYQELKTETAIASQQLEPGTGEFSSKFLEILGPAEDYAQIMLTLNGKTIYRYPPENVEVNLDLTRTYSESIVTLYGNTLEITASLYTVKPSSIFYHGRLSFLLILAGTVCALLILLVTKIVEDQNSTSGYWKYTEDDGIQNNSEKPLFSHEKNESTVNAAPAPEYNDEASAEQYTSEEPETAVEPETPVRQEEPQVTEAPAEEEFKEPEIFGNSDSDSQEQKNLPEALDELITQAAAEEQDITVLIIKISGLNKEDEIAVKFQEEIRSKFFQHGLLYNFTEDSYAVIIKNTDLDAAMVSAEELRDRLLSIASDNSFTTEITMGISSRSVRIISAERLITEADKAREHSDAESPIIAFRVNPEKYREYILNNS